MSTIFGIALVVLFVVLLVKTLRIRSERKVDEFISNRIGK